MIIGLCGHIGSGKSLIAREIVYRMIMLEGKHAMILSIATPVKEIAEKHFGWDHKKDDKGRRLLQVIGTEAGRDYNPELWVDKLDDRIKRQVEGTIVIVDDVRFDNEVEYIERNGGKVFKIERNAGQLSEHISENGIDYRKHKITVVDNNGAVDDAVGVILNPN